MDFEHRLSPATRLWLAVLDQACADHGSPSARVRAEAAEWWAGDMPAVFSRALDIPLSRLARLRDARGGLRCAADGGGAGRKLGVKVPMGHAYDYDIRRVHLSGLPSRRMTG
jgi:hypothetical protein